MRLPALRSIGAALRDPKRWRRWILDALILAAIVGGISYWQSHGLPDGVAPPLAGVRTDGSTVKVGAGGTASLVVFWGIWCPICRAEEGNISSVAEDWPVISVATQSGDAATVAKYLAERGIALPALIDEGGFIAADWRVRATPTHFIVDPAGKVRFRLVGYTTTLGLRTRLWWAQNVGK